MLQVLLVLVTISAVYCQNCPQFAAFPNDNKILKLLKGTFYQLYTTEGNVIKCSKVTWTGTGNDLVCITQSPGCCRKIYNPITSNPNEVDFTVTALNNNTGCILGTERVIFKFIATTGSGDSLCLIYSACRTARQGVYIACRQRGVSQSLFGKIIAILANLLTSILGLLGLGSPNSPKFPSLQYFLNLPNLPNLGSLSAVPQTDCVFPDNNCST